VHFPQVIIKVSKALIRARKACLKIRKAFKVLKHRRHAGLRLRGSLRVLTRFLMGNGKN
jgi:hypothetical protein